MAHRCGLFYFCADCKGGDFSDNSSRGKFGAGDEAERVVGLAVRVVGGNARGLEEEVNGIL